MKKISIEEADKILAAHRPKAECCPYCGVNLKDSHIPKSRVEAKIKELEKLGELKKPHVRETVDIVKQVLKDLLNNTEKVEGE